MKFSYNLLNEQYQRLEIETDETDTGGAFIYYYDYDGNAYDTWHNSLESAFESATDQFGINREDWEVLAD